jgi:hypothetical protein
MLPRPPDSGPPELTAAGCGTVRVAVPSQDDADVPHLIAKKRQIQGIAEVGVCLPAPARPPGSATGSTSCPGRPLHSR